MTAKSEIKHKAYFSDHVYHKSTEFHIVLRFLYILSFFTGTSHHHQKSPPPETGTNWSEYWSVAKAKVNNKVWTTNKVSLVFQSLVEVFGLTVTPKDEIWIKILSSTWW